MCTAVRHLEPLRQLVRGVIGCLPVEGHHGRRHAGHAPQLRAPPTAYRRHFDVVHTAANGFFEAMNVHVFSCPE